MEVKDEKVCRTCLNDGSTTGNSHDLQYFNISHAFDHVTISQMITDITALQIDSSDGYTQSICFKCVKEVKRAHKFRKKCIESSETLINTIKNDTPQKQKYFEEIPVLSHCKVEPPEADYIKEEPEDSFACTDILETEYKEDDEDSLKTEPDETESNKSDNDEETNEDFNLEQDANKKNMKIIFDCSLCHALFINENIFKKHILEFHPGYEKDDNFNKDRAPQGFIIKQKINKTVKKFYKCALDDFAGKSFVEFKHHMKKHVGERPIACTLCDFKTKDIPLLKKHKFQKHTEVRNISCPHCDYVGKRKSDLTNHLIVHTTERNFQCELCMMSFKRMSILTEHKKIKHEKIEPTFKCTVCQKGFYYKNKLKYHMAIHTGERPHVCHYCGMAFNQRSILVTHVASKHEISNATFKCDLCPFTAKRKVYLTAHQKIHTGEKDYHCPHCPFKAYKKNNLKVHIMRHFGETRYSCDMCDYKCMILHQLTIHKRVHTGERPFPCTICGAYSGKSKHALQRHLDTHNTELKFTCPNCPFKINSRELLQKHIRNKCVIKKRGRRPSKSASLPVQSNNLLPNNGDNQILGESSEGMQN